MYKLKMSDLVLIVIHKKRSKILLTGIDEFLKGKNSLINSWWIIVGKFASLIIGGACKKKKQKITKQDQWLTTTITQIIARRIS